MVMGIRGEGVLSGDDRQVRVRVKHGPDGGLRRWCSVIKKNGLVGFWARKCC